MAVVPKIDREAVYWIEDPKKLFVPEIAGDVEYHAEPGELCYRDTQRPHIQPMKFVREEPGGALVFEAPNRTAVLRKLDLATFNKVLRSLTHGAPPFKNDRELQDFYRTLIRSN